MPTGCIVARQYGILVPTIFVIDLTSRIVLSLIEAAGAGQAQGGPGSTPAAATLRLTAARFLDGRRVIVG